MTGRSAAGISGKPRTLGAAIFVVALLVRLIPLGFYVTPDEPIWVMRSAQALQAVASGNWASIPQTGHPGITTMALGALGIWLTKLFAPQVAAGHLDWILRMAWLAPENSAAFPHLAYFLPAGRLLVALVTSGATAGVYLLGRRRLGARAARLAALFLALDPVWGGYGGLLHTDALQASFLVLAALLLLPVHDTADASLAGGRRWGWVLPWVGAALCLALAGLTKTLGLLVAPGLALAALLWTPGPWGRRVGRVAGLTGLTGVLLLALYPPFWLGPVAAVRGLIAAVSYHEGIGLREVFFAGRTQVDPGPAFYPAVVLFRLTPPVLVGLVAGLVGRRRALRSSPVRAGWFLLPVVVYVGALTLATKKFDRYVLSAIPFLTIVAALIWRDLRRRWRWALLATLGLPWALVAVTPLQYATPLLGGPWVAARVVPLGWGEASGLAARKLNATLPSPATATLMARDVPGTASIFAGQVRPWQHAAVGCTDALVAAQGEVSATYVSAGDVQVAGRRLGTVWRSNVRSPSGVALVAPGPLPGLPVEAAAPVADAASLQAWLAARAADGTPFLWVHAPQCYPLAEQQLSKILRDNGSPASCTPADSLGGFAVESCMWQAPAQAAAPYLARFQGALDLLSATWGEPVQAPDALAVRLRWRAVAPSPDLDAYLALQSVTADDDVIWADGGRLLLNAWGWKVSDWPVNSVVDAEAYIPLPLDLPPGTYRLTFSLADSGHWLGLARPDGTFGGTQLVLGNVRVAAPPYPAGALDLAESLDVWWPGLHVIGASLPTDARLAGERLPFSLGLERVPGTVPASLTWTLTCDGAVRDGGALPWPVSSPDAWPEGHRYVLRFAPRLGTEVPSGTCKLTVTATGDTSGGTVSGTVTISQRPRSFAPPAAPELPLDVSVGDFGALTGAGGVPATLRAGDATTLTLTWRAFAAADRDYTVFAHLIGPDGQVAAQSDRPPAGGTAPTMTWMDGEIVADTHVLKLADKAPPGVYALYVGLYDAERGTRVPLYEGDEATPLPDARAPIATIEVLP